MCNFSGSKSHITSKNKEEVKAENNNKSDLFFLIY